MSKKQKPVVTTTNSTFTPDPMVQAAQKNLLTQGQDILDPYLKAGTSGYGVAGFNPDQNTAFQGVRDNLTSAMAGGGGINGEDISKFLNPYTRDVVDTTNQTLRDQNDITLNGIRARAAAGSSFGGSGSRAALQESGANEALGKTIASTTAQLMAQGYDRATATALASRQMETSTKQSALQAMLGIGNQQQQLAQTQMDVPLTAIQRLQALTPQQYASTTNGTTTAPPPQGPSALQSILGLAGTLGGAALGGPMGASLGGSLFGGLAAPPAADSAAYANRLRAWS